MKALVIGLGEVGYPIYKMLVKTYGDGDIIGYDPAKEGHDVSVKEPCEFLHICFPQTVNFIEQVGEYVKEHDPAIVIVHSTLSPGISEKLSYWLRPDAFCEKPGLFYSPVRGNIRDGMTWGLETYTKYLAPVLRGRRSRLSLTKLDEHYIETAKTHLEESGMTVQLCDWPSLEYAKLFNLAYYGTCIAIFQEFERIIEDENLDYEVIKSFIESTETEAQAGDKRVPRTLYYGGYIGGHCIIPGMEKILAKHPGAGLFRAVMDSNIKRERELLLKTTS